MGDKSFTITCPHSTFEHLKEEEATEFIYSTFMPACEAEGVLLFEDGNINEVSNEQNFYTEEKYRIDVNNKRLWNIENLQSAVMYVRANYAVIKTMKPVGHIVEADLSNQFEVEMGNGFAAAALAIAGFTVSFKFALHSRLRMTKVNVENLETRKMIFKLLGSPTTPRFEKMNPVHAENVIYNVMLKDLEAMGIYLTADGNCNQTVDRNGSVIPKLKAYFEKKQSRTLFNTGTVQKLCAWIRTKYRTSARYSLPVSERLANINVRLGNPMSYTLGEGIAAFILNGVTLHFSLKSYLVYADPMACVKPVKGESRSLKRKRED